MMQIQNITIGTTQIFSSIVEGDNSKYIDYFQYFLITFQSFTVFLNVISSILIFFNNKGALGKYFSHSSWCISSLNLLFLSIVTFFFYLIAVLIINFSAFQNKLADSDITWTKTDLTDSSFVSCLQPYDQKADYDFYNNTIVESLDLFSTYLYNITFLNSIDPFYIMNTVNELIIISKEVSLPNNVFNYELKEIDAASNLLEILNNIVSDKGDYAYQVLDKCVDTTDLEVQFDSASCRYPFVDANTLTFDLISNGRYCVVLTDLTVDILKKLFENLLLNKCKKDKKILYGNFNNLYEQLIEVYKILSSFYNEFTEFKNFFIDEILLS